MKKIMKKLKGFTLIELLAVIVILAIILLIVMPIVLNVINDARKGTFEASARGLARTAENECYSRQLDSGRVQVIYTFENGVQTVEPSEEDLLKFSGKAPSEGYILVDMNCKVEFKLSDGTWYVEKDKDNNEIVIEEYVDQELEPLILPEYINNPEEPDYPEHATPCEINELEFTHILDKRDETTYAVTKIGDQCWFAENLRYTTTDCLNETWREYDVDTNPYPSACQVTGGTDWNQNEVHYQWGAAMDGSTTAGAQGLCPLGWKVPTDGELTTLTNYVNSVPEYRCNDENNQIAKALASTNHWASTEIECAVGNNPNTNNATGFNKMPAGYCITSGPLVNVDRRGNWWSSSASSSGNHAWYRALLHTWPTVARNSSWLAIGYSVRCLMD